MRKNVNLLLLILLGFCQAVYSQIALNTTGNNPHSSAALDIDFTNKGVLIPRVALTSATDNTTISSPATSLLVYNTGTGGLSPAGYYYWNGSQWVQFGLANHTHATLTFNNSGSGAPSGSTYNGSSALTVSYNTIGAASSSHTHATLSNGAGIATFSYNGSSAATVAVNFGTTAGTVAEGNHTHSGMVTGTGTTNYNAYWTSSNTIGAEQYVAISRGGTGLGTTPTNGQLLIGNGTGYSLNTLTAGSGITITNGAGTITISATGGGGTVTSIGAGTSGTETGSSGLTFSSNPITGSGTIALANSGVTAGTYGNTGANIPYFTVDARGRLTAANNRTLTASDIGAITSSCGTANYIPKMTSASNISCSQLYDNATAVQIGSTSLTNCKLGVVYSNTDRYGIYASTPGYAIYGNAAGGGGGRGVIGDGGEIGVMGSYGSYTSSNTWGKLGFYESTPIYYGVYGYSYDSRSSGSNFGVRGRAGNNSVRNVGVWADVGSVSVGSNNYGVYADACGPSNVYGVYAKAHNAGTGYAVYADGQNYGVYAIAYGNRSGNAAVFGRMASGSGTTTYQGIRGEAAAPTSGYDVRGIVGLGDGAS